MFVFKVSVLSLSVLKSFLTLQSFFLPQTLIFLWQSVFTGHMILGISCWKGSSHQYMPEESICLHEVAGYNIQRNNVKNTTTN